MPANITITMTPDFGTQTIAYSVGYSGNAHKPTGFGRAGLAPGSAYVENAMVGVEWKSDHLFEVNLGNASPCREMVYTSAKQQGENVYSCTGKVLAKATPGRYKYFVAFVRATAGTAQVLTDDPDLVIGP